MKENNLKKIERKDLGRQIKDEITEREKQNGNRQKINISPSGGNKTFQVENQIFRQNFLMIFQD